MHTSSKTFPPRWICHWCSSELPKKDRRKLELDEERNSRSVCPFGEFTFCMCQKNYCEFVEAANRASGRAISKIKARAVFAQAVLLSTERNKRWLGPQFKASNACTTLIIHTSLKKHCFFKFDFVHIHC